MIEDKLSVEKAHQRLIFRGKQLSEDNTLFEADVDLNSVIQLWEVKAPPPPPASKYCPCPESDDSDKENNSAAANKSKVQTEKKKSKEDKVEVEEKT